MMNTKVRKLVCDVADAIKYEENEMYVIDFYAVRQLVKSTNSSSPTKGKGSLETRQVFFSCCCNFNVKTPVKWMILSTEN